jgi:hypothetical protein
VPVLEFDSLCGSGLETLRKTLRQPPFMQTINLTRKNLEDDPSVIYFLNPRLRITYCNLAWDRFASQNGGQDLAREVVVGRPVMDAVPAPLKPFYNDAYDRVLSSQKPWEYTYECSSATTYRSFRMSIFPDPDNSGLMIVNSLTVERPHGSEREPSNLTDVYTTKDHGITTMCCHCRRTRKIDQKEVWDWVPGFVERPPRLVSHGICPVCRIVFYPGLLN